MEATTITFEQALKNYINALQAYADNDFKTNYPKSFAENLQPKYTFSYGKRLVKVINERIGQKSVFCFIDPKTGDLYKAASWNSPAKGIRGNIYNDNLPLTEGGFYRY